MKYGAGMPRGGKSNNSGGGTQAKTGTMYTPLCRASQFSTTMGAMTNRTRSQHSATSMNNLWKGISEDQGGNILGWRPE